MKSVGLFSELKKHPWIMALVILVHIGVILLLSINLLDNNEPPVPASQKHKIIDAVAVDAKLYDERKKQKKLAAQKKIDDKKAAKKRAADKKRLADKKKKQEAERKNKLEKKRLAEKKKQLKVAADKKKALVIAKKKEADRKLKEKLIKERQVKEKLAKEKKAAELKAAELKERQRVEAEKQRKIKEEKQRRAEEKAEFERALIEEERLEEEARARAVRAARLQTLRDKYIIDIAQKVERNWLRPVSNSEGQSCDVIVTQTMMGDVIDVKVQSCTSDNAFQRSVESAVHKASPLPMPPDPELFDREIYFKFKPR